VDNEGEEVASGIEIPATNTVPTVAAAAATSTSTDDVDKW
jgi:hypothetical protein